VGWLAIGGFIRVFGGDWGNCPSGGNQVSFYLASIIHFLFLFILIGVGRWRGYMLGFFIDGGFLVLLCFAFG